MTVCTTCFYLWLRIDELFKLQMKHLQFDVNINNPSGNLSHFITLFFLQTRQKQGQQRTNIRSTQITGKLNWGLHDFFLRQMVDGA